MEDHEKLAILQKDLAFLEEDLKNSQELRDALHREASPHLYVSQLQRIDQLEKSIEKKKSDIISISLQMAATEKPLK
jgi:hypothetical protein